MCASCQHGAVRICQKESGEEMSWVVWLKVTDCEARSWFEPRIEPATLLHRTHIE